MGWTGMSDEVQVEASDEGKLIGSNESEFEAVLLDGCLGFGFSVGNAVFSLAMVLVGIQAAAEKGIVASYAAAVVALMLFLGMRTTDTLQTKRGRGFTLALYVTAFAGVAVCAVLGGGGVYYISILFAALGFASTIMLYGQFLAALARAALMLVIDSVFLYVGVLMLIASQVSAIISTALLCVSCLVSVGVSIASAGRFRSYAKCVSAEDSKSRSIKLKGNNHTLLLIGFMFSITLFVSFANLSDLAVVLTMGASIGVAGLVSLLSRCVNERSYKEFLKKTMSLSTIVLLLPLPIVPDQVKLVLVAMYMCFVMLNVNVLANAVVESTRFDTISPVWLFGKDGAIFFCGVFLGAAFFAVSVFASQSIPDVPVLHVACYGAVAFCAWMQIDVNYQIYPFEPVIESDANDEVVALYEQEGRRKYVWQHKIEVACQQYKLSPREEEVLRILLKGRDARYIMDKFFISYSTAKTHIYNIYRKFGIHSRQELYDFIEEIELLDDEGRPSEV